MRIHYTGKLEKLDAASQRNLDARFARLGKLLDGKSEKEAHVILKTQRHLFRAEITVNSADRQLVGDHAGADNLTALLGACDKLEKQLARLHDKRLDQKRRAGKNGPVVSSEPTPAKEAAPAPAAKIYRIAPRSTRKPMTVDEAVLEVTDRRPYVVYRDAGSEKLSVLIRRPDGHFDLLETER